VSAAGAHLRIAIVGNSGSGKSVLARELAARHHLPALDLDTVAWEPGKIAVARPIEDALADVRAFTADRERWVVEGCYAELTRAALGFSPLLIFLEPGLERCLENCRNRPWEPHKYASKAEQDSKLEFLLAWVRDYYTRDGDLSLRAHQALFDEYAGPKRKVTNDSERADVLRELDR
jgi:adenylate kinase family enzyme